MSIVVSGKYIVTPYKIIKGGKVVIDDNRIVEVGKRVSEPQGAERLEGDVVIPGLINAHTHLAMTLFRGFADDVPLEVRLKDHIRPVEAMLKPEHVYAGALVGALESLYAGVTTVASMYFYMDQEAQAIVDVGIRGELSQGMIGITEESRKEAKRKTEEFVRLRGNKDPRIRVAVGPHAPYTVNKDMLLEAKEMAEEYSERLGYPVMIHIHVAESPREPEEIKKARNVDVYKYGGVASYLYDIGFLHERVLAAHVVRPTRRDLSVLKRSNAKVAHNPQSNLKLASGIAPIKEMLNYGITVALGTDGAGSNNNLDVLLEARFAALLAKGRDLDPEAVPAKEALKMATVYGAKALGREGLGEIKPGNLADLVVLDFSSPHVRPLEEDRIISHIIYAAKSSDVKHVIVNGEIVLEDRKPTKVNVEKVKEKFEKAIRDLF